LPVLRCRSHAGSGAFCPASYLVERLWVFLAGLAPQLPGASPSHMVTCISESAHRSGQVRHRYARTAIGEPPAAPGQQEVAGAQRAGPLLGLPLPARAGKLADWIIFFLVSRLITGSAAAWWALPCSLIYRN
jgi:hypothetical protein